MLKYGTTICIIFNLFSFLSHSIFIIHSLLMHSRETNNSIVMLIVFQYSFRQLYVWLPLICQPHLCLPKIFPLFHFNHTPKFTPTHLTLHNYHYYFSFLFHYFTFISLSPLISTFFIFFFLPYITLPPISFIKYTFFDIFYKKQLS